MKNKCHKKVRTNTLNRSVMCHMGSPGGRPDIYKNIIYIGLYTYYMTHYIYIYIFNIINKMVSYDS